MMSENAVIDAWSWVQANREWLFSGIGLSVTLLVAGLLWKLMTWLGWLSVRLSLWISKRVSSLWARLRQRGDGLAAAKSDEAAEARSILDPETSGRPLVLEPSKADIDASDQARADHELMMLGQTTGEGPFSYLHSRNNRVKLKASRRAMYSKAQGSSLARLLFLAALINLIWVAASSLL